MKIFLYVFFVIVFLLIYAKLGKIADDVKVIRGVVTQQVEYKQSH